MSNMSNTGHFPECLKLCTVIPLFKEGNKTYLNNYRPISIVPTFSKIFEKFLAKKLIEHLNKNEILHNCQFGYIMKSNTEAAVTHLMKEIYDSIELKRTTAVLFIDFSKAFDTIDLNLMIIKLGKLHLPNKLMKVITSYLTNRKQRVQIKDRYSNFANIKDGVPQGSILGPFLFLICINSMASLKLCGKLQLFADDLALVYSCNSVDELKLEMENDLDNVTNWLSTHRMTMNISKTHYILFDGRKKLDAFTKNNTRIIFNSQQIVRVEESKYLGLIIDEKLNFLSHINHIKSKIRPMIYAIKRTRPFINSFTGEILYFSYIYSHLIYLNKIWSAANNEEIKTIEIFQRKAVKCIYKFPNLKPTKEIYNEKILPFSIVSDMLLTILPLKSNSA